MASISHDGGGFRRILFKSPITGKRDKIHLGKTTAKSATTILAHIEAIIESKELNRSLEPETASWLRGLGDEFYAKLASKGLAPSRTAAAQQTLGVFTDEFITKRQAKASSKQVWRAGQSALVEYLGADKLLSDVTPGMADDFLQFLKGRAVGGPAKTDGTPVKTLSNMTIRNKVNFAKMIFRAAMRHKLVASNPFDEVKIEATMPDRSRFITRDETQKLLDACPNQDWRTIIVLARYGGLRLPSEVLSAKWESIDWQRGRMTFASPKTEHHRDGATRTIPLFPELRSELAAIWTPESTGYVVNEKYRRLCQCENGWCNGLRDQFLAIIKRAGLTPWPRLFHNLRSTRQTELEENFPTHVVCCWLGNTQAIARNHYLQTTDDHFQRATAQTTAQTVANQSGLEATKEQRELKMPTPVVVSPLQSGELGDVSYLGRRDQGVGCREQSAQFFSCVFSCGFSLAESFSSKSAIWEWASWV